MIYKETLWCINHAFWKLSEQHSEPRCSILALQSPVQWEKLGGKRKNIPCNYFFSSILEKKCYSLDRREGCLLSTFLSFCSASPRITYKITFKWSLTLLFGTGFMALEQFCCFKGLLAVVCGAIADNLWWALWHRAWEWWTNPTMEEGSEGKQWAHEPQGRMQGVTTAIAHQLSSSQHKVGWPLFW